jgi:hypothetical protein
MNPWSLYEQEDVTNPEDLMAQIAASRSPAGNFNPVAAALIQSQGMGSGRQQTSKDQSLDKTLRVVNEVTYPTPETIQNVLGAISKSPEIMAQKEGLNNIKSAILSQLDNSSGVDYTSPLSYLANYYTNGKAQYIPQKAPPQKQLLDFALKMQDDQRDLSKTIADYVGRFKGGTTQLQDINQQLSELVNKSGIYPNPRGSNQLPPEARAIRDVQKTFNKAVEPFNKALNYADQVDNIINNAGPGRKIAKKTVETILARARSEVGNLSQYEQSGTASAQSALDRLDQFVQTIETGELTDTNKEAIKDLVKQFRSASYDNIKANRQVHSKQGAEAYGVLGLTQDKFNQSLSAIDTAKPMKQDKPEEKKKSLMEEYMEYKKAKK